MALIGAGARGKEVYGDYAINHPHEVEFIAIAEPNEQKRNAFAQIHKISKENIFSSWEELLAKPKLCEAVLIASQDRMHYLPTVTALEKKYHVLLEKPMSNDSKECMLMAKKAKDMDKLLIICHVLRYTPFFKKVKSILDEGKIGRMISIQHIESVGYWHQAHSFVRGNWRNSHETSPMILAKSCHDMDILSWLIGSRCIKVSSFGALTYFKSENAPKGSARRCTDDCQVENLCPYSALKIYPGNNEWPTNVVSTDTSYEAVIEALKTGPYGRCVFQCDNNVVDHQVVNMEFEDGVTVDFTMSAFTKVPSRNIRIMGTHGELRADMETNTIELFDFITGNQEIIKVREADGHSGGDSGLMRAFVEQVSSNGKSESLTSADISIQSHLMAFAAEESRLKNKTIFMAEFEKEVLKE